MMVHQASWAAIFALFILLLVILGSPLRARGRRRRWRWGVLPVLLLGPVLLIGAWLLLSILSYDRARHQHSTSAVLTHTHEQFVHPYPHAVEIDRHAEVSVSDTKGYIALAHSSGQPSNAALPRESRSLEDWSRADHWPASRYSTIERAGQALAEQVAEYLIDNGPDDVETVTVVASSARHSKRHREMHELVPLGDTLRSLGWTDVKVHLTTDSTVEDFSEEEDEEETDFAPLPRGKSILPSVPSMPKLPLKGNAKDWEQYGKAMERWGEQFSEHMDEWGEHLGKRFENFGEHMDEWGEQFGKRYEDFGERVATEAERRARETAERVKSRLREKAEQKSAERKKKERKPEKPKKAPKAKQLPEPASKPGLDRVEQDQAEPFVRLVLRGQRSSGGWIHAAIRLVGSKSPEKRIGVRYVDKPWVRENRHNDSRGRRYVIGRSDMEPTSNEALRRANADAIGQVRALLEARLQQHNWSPADRMTARNRIPQAVARFVEEHRTDEFTQELHSRRVDVHRAAVLVSADDGSLASTVDEVVYGTRVARKSFLQQMAGGGVLGVFLLLAYFFLNAGTKGHFAWKLRTLCACTYTILCWAIFHFGLFS